jgi:hypothetical protein
MNLLHGIADNIRHTFSFHLRSSWHGYGATGRTSCTERDVGVEATVLQNNATSLARLQAIVGSLDERTMRLSVEDGWSISAVLAHLAFWEHSFLTRCDAFRDHGNFVTIDEDTEHLINVTSLPLWRSIPGRIAANMALEAATAATIATAAMTADLESHLTNQQCQALVDHSHHRNAHLDAITEVLDRYEVAVAA